MEHSPKIHQSLPSIYILAVIIFLVTIFLSGCAGLGRPLEPPKINIVNIQPKEMKGLESVLQVELRIFNTNDIPITIKGLDCQLDLNDRRFAVGVSNDEKTIPAFGTETISILFYTSVLDVFRGVIGLQDKEKLKYRIKGKVRLYTDSLPAVRVPFNSEGEISLSGVSGGV